MTHRDYIFCAMFIKPKIATGECKIGPAACAVVNPNRIARRWYAGQFAGFLLPVISGRKIEFTATAFTKKWTCLGHQKLMRAPTRNWCDDGFNFSITSVPGANI